LPMGANVARVLLLAIAGNTVISVLKVVGGLISASTALLADGSDSILNVISALIAYRFYVRAQRPPDARHPYGHSKFEAFGSMLILLFMVATFSFVGFEALDRFMHGWPEKIGGIGIAFALASLILNFFVSYSLRLLGRDSQIALTESRHTSLDVAEGVTTLVGVTLGALYSAVFDLVATIVILAIVAFFIYETVGELRGEVVDTSPPSPLLRDIEDLIKSTPGVLGVHSLRARMAGSKVFTDVHIEVDPSMTVEEAHMVCDDVEKRIRERFNGKVDVTLHVEPSPEGESGENKS